MRPAQLDCNMKMIVTDILVLQCQAENITAVLSPVTGGKGQNKDFSEVVDRIVELKTKLSQMTADWIQATKEVQAVIEMLPDPKKRTVLHKRYFENKTLVFCNIFYFFFKTVNTKIYGAMKNHSPFYYN